MKIIGLFMGVRYEGYRKLCRIVRPLGSGIVWSLQPYEGARLLEFPEPLSLHSAESAGRRNSGVKAREWALGGVVLTTTW